MLGNIIVVLIVLLAAFISIRKIYKTLAGKSGCSCACGSSNGSMPSCCSSACQLKNK
ncbi:MAG: hypothetical protein K2N11_09820 [Mucispirillum sp.]|nr:hypothetical protein [Mucispirillum sp.]